jgi:uncharacterized membrane protein affecting hemolysin expression
MLNAQILGFLQMENTAKRAVQVTDFGSTLRPENITSLNDVFVASNNDAETLTTLLNELCELQFNFATNNILL